MDLLQDSSGRVGLNITIDSDLNSPLIFLESRVCREVVSFQYHEDEVMKVVDLLDWQLSPQ